MEDERGTFRPVMARKEREREGKESSDYLKAAWAMGGISCDLRQPLSSLILRGSAQRQSQKAKARARVNHVRETGLTHGYNRYRYHLMAIYGLDKPPYRLTNTIGS